MKHAASNLIVVMMIAAFSLILLATLGSRLILSLGRTKSFADSALVLYAAETGINDLIARLNYLSFPISTVTQFIPDGPPSTYGTTIKYWGEENPINTKTLHLTTSRSGATTELQAQQVKIVSPYTHAEILLVLDATFSMLCPSNTNGTTIQCPADYHLITTYDNRFKALHDAAYNFIVSAQAQDTSHTKFFIGLPVFRSNSVWLKNISGQEMTPNLAAADATSYYTNLKSAIDFGFSPTQTTLPPNGTYYRAYNQLFGNTSIGSGLRFANQYFASVTDPTAKKVFILITDGEPDSSIPDPDCKAGDVGNHNMYYCPQSSFYCHPANITPYPPAPWRCNTDYNGNYIFPTGVQVYNVATGGDPSPTPGLPCNLPALNQTGCQLAGTTTPVPAIPSQNGRRDLLVEPYVLTVQGDIAGNVKQVFEDFTPKTPTDHYIQLQDANRLNAALQAILDEINHFSSTLTISHPR